MKKTGIAVLFTIFISMLIPAFAEDNFIRGTSGFDYRYYYYTEYLDGRYRDNFESVPQKKMLDQLEGFRAKVGVFELDKNTLYLGWTENGFLQLCDKDGKFFITANSSNYQDESFFRFYDPESGLVTGQGKVTEITLKGKQYTIAVAGIASNQLNVFTDNEGFRMWVEKGPAKDESVSVIDDTYNMVNYPVNDILDGVYKAGWRRIFGTLYSDENTWPPIYKYSYKGTDFLFTGETNDGEKWLYDMNGNLIPLENVSGFYVYEKINNDNIRYNLGLGVEADIKLGKKKYRIMYFQYNGMKRVFVKEK